MGTASLIIGVVAIVFSFIPFINWIALIGAVVGIILGAMGMKKEPQKKNIAIAGMVLNIIAIVIIVISIATCAACAVATQKAVKEMETSLILITLKAGFLLG